MIIWISSYPKSGNTWVRSLLSAYLYSENGIFNFEHLKKINQFPSKTYFKFFMNDFSDIKKVSEHWIAAQDRININEDIKYFKTHSALCTLAGNSFTNKSNTKAAIYVVRDPRNVITSFAHHYSININEAYKRLTNKSFMIYSTKPGDDDYGTATILGSWSAHYNSWKNIKFAPILIIKYEDLIFDTKKTFLNILNFLSKIVDIKIDEKKVIDVIKSTSFDILAKKESQEGFIESVKSTKDNSTIKFFNLGEKNNWKEILDKKIEYKIRTEFSKDMKELNYI
mgnify:CR=1 FL=1